MKTIEHELGNLRTYLHIKSVVDFAENWDKFLKNFCINLDCRYEKQSIEKLKLFFKSCVDFEIPPPDDFLVERSYSECIEGSSFRKFLNKSPNLFLTWNLSSTCPLVLYKTFLYNDGRLVLYSERTI
jgi:hypothetical protein